MTRPTTGRSKWILFALLPNFILYILQQCLANLSSKSKNFDITLDVSLWQPQGCRLREESKAQTNARKQICPGTSLMVYRSLSVYPPIPEEKIIISLALFGSSNSAFALCLLDRQDGDSQNVKTDYIWLLQLPLNMSRTASESNERTASSEMKISPTWSSMFARASLHVVDTDFPISRELSKGFDTIPLLGGLSPCTGHCPADWEAEILCCCAKEL